MQSATESPGEHFLDIWSIYPNSSKQQLVQIIGKQLCQVQSAKANKQSATQSLCEHFLDICRTQLLSHEPSAQPTLENSYQNCTRLNRIFYYCAGLNRIAYIYKLLHIDQLGKCEILHRVARGTVMFALDFI